MEYSNKKQRNMLFLSVALIVTCIILLVLCKYNSKIADSIFVPLARILLVPLKAIFNLTGIAIFEILIIIALPLVTFVVYKVVKKNQDMTNKQFYLYVGNHILFVFAVLMLFYMFLYGLPCTRTPVIDKIYNSQQVTDNQELYDMTVRFIEMSNKYQTDNKDFSFEETYNELKDAYEKAKKKYSYIDGVGAFPSRAKKALFSVPMSYLSTTGIFMPFTGEAAVSTDNPKFVISYTMAHEMAHSMLVSREDEANFFAFVVSLETTDTKILYSAYFNAMIYSLNALANADENLYAKAWEHMSRQVYDDIMYNNKHIDKYSGFTSKFGSFVNDIHLKASGQTGIESYSLVVNLLLKWYEGNC